MLRKLQNCKDVIYRNTEYNLEIYYQESLCDIIEFMKMFSFFINEKDCDLDVLLPGICRKISGDEDEIIQLVFSGLLIGKRNDIWYVFDLSKAPSRITSDSIADPEDIFGSRDGFVENFKVNIALIRTRVKDEKMNIDSFNIGRRSKTIVSLLSIEDIHNKNIKNMIVDCLKNIDIDAVISISDLMAYFQKDNIFPVYRYLGNPHDAANRLYNGEFIIIIDRICCAVCLPTTLAYSSRMKIDNINIPFYPLIERLFVFISAIFSVTLCAIICSMTTFQRDSLPLSALVGLKLSQEGIILPIYLEILVVLALFELYYLIGFKQSKVTISSTIVLFGGLIIGENLVGSGLAGVVLITGTAVGFLLTFVVSSNVTTIAAISVMRLFLLLSSLFYGFVGLMLSSILLVCKLYNQKTLGVHYLFPFLPFDLNGVIKFFIPNSRVKNKKRDEGLGVNNMWRKKHD